MAWDEELEDLATYVRQHFGEGVLKDAGRRAMTSLTALDVAHDAISETDEVIEGADGQLYSIDAFWEAIRRELQRLVTPQ